MFPNLPFERVNWISSSFLIVTFLLALIGAPLYLWHFGLDAFQVALFWGSFFLTGISITMGYHRLFAHRSFKAKAPIRLATLIFGACAFEDSALDWASDHRRHHKHTDEEEDPYGITRGFFWAHMGWILFKLYPRPLENVADLRKDPLVMWQHRWHRVISVVAGVVAPTFLGFLWNGGAGALGGFLLAGVTRIVCVQHCTFFINSLCHTLGCRPYSGTTSARDSWFMALFTFGEGYHNFHHSFQHDYRNGVKRWQFDPTKWCIQLLQKLGLVSDLRRASPEKILLAELRELHRKTESQMARLETIPPRARSCPRFQAGLCRVRARGAAFLESYAELERSVANRVRLSASALQASRETAGAFWKELTALDRLRAAYR